MSEEIEKPRDLEFYLSDHTLNISIHQGFEEIGVKEQLAGFKTFYRLLNLVKEGKTLEAIGRINSVESGGFQLFLTYYLRERIREDARVIDNPQNTTAALHLLDKEYSRLEKLFPPDIIMLNPDSIDERSQYAVGLHELSKEAVNRMVDKMMKEAEEKQNIELRARQDERERLEQTLIPQIQNAVMSASSKKNPEFTTARQVLAVSYMLKRLGMKNVDKKTQADFIEFLTNKTHREIYDRVRDSLLVYNRDNKDAEYVKDWFQRLGLTEIVNDMDADLSGSAKKK
jgi:hypothetical protein